MPDRQPTPIGASVTAETAPTVPPCRKQTELRAVPDGDRDGGGSGPTPAEVYDIPFTSVSSFVLLMSSLTMVLALAAIGFERGLIRSALPLAGFVGMLAGALQRPIIDKTGLSGRFDIDFKAAPANGPTAVVSSCATSNAMLRA